MYIYIYIYRYIYIDIHMRATMRVSYISGVKHLIMAVKTGFLRWLARSIPDYTLVYTYHNMFPDHGPNINLTWSNVVP